MQVFAIVVTAAAIIRVAHGVARLTSSTDRRAGIDLVFRWHEVHAWFAGLPVYGRLETADYPPASYPVLWPFIGWTDTITTARWIWAAVTLGLLLWFAWMLWREAAGRSMSERACLASLPLCGYATHGLLVTGQVTVLALVPLLAGLLLLARSKSLATDIVGAALVIVGLVKPTLTVPLVWIAFLVPGRLRPAALIVGGYAAMTLFAAAYQADGVIQLAQGWLAQGDRVNLGATYGNLQKVLGMAGGGDLFLPIALLVIVATGAWVYRHRAVDIWLLIGATALVARLLTYHRSFDDMLVVLAVMAVFRTSVTASSHGARAMATVLTIALFAGTMAPRVALAEVSIALELINRALPILWLFSLGFIALEAHRRRIAIESSRASTGAMALAA